MVRGAGIGRCDSLHSYAGLQNTGKYPMPFKSEAQRGWMYANEPAMAKRWEAHTPKGKKLPKKVNGEKESAFAHLPPLMQKVAALGAMAAQLRVIKQAKDMPSFTEQDRPEKTKDIYRALKREHPEMSAEMKARIAARQGKSGKQKQGPPYKGPLSTEK